MKLSDVKAELLPTGLHLFPSITADDIKVPRSSFVVGDLASLEHQRAHLKKVLASIASCDTFIVLISPHWVETTFKAASKKPTQSSPAQDAQSNRGLSVCKVGYADAFKTIVYIKWSAIPCGALLLHSLEAIAKAIARRLTVLDWMIATLLRLQSKTTFLKVLTLLERAWFLLHGSHPPRAITLQRPALGY